MSQKDINDRFHALEKYIEMQNNKISELEETVISQSKTIKVLTSTLMKQNTDEVHNKNGIQVNPVYIYV